MADKKRNMDGKWTCSHCGGRAEWLSEENVVCHGSKDCGYFGPEDEFSYEPDRTPRCCDRKMELAGDVDDPYYLCETCSSRIAHHAAEVEADIKTAIINHEFELTEEELLGIGEKLGELDGEIEQAEGEKKLIVSQWGAKIKTMQADVKRLTRLLRDKAEWRDVECEVKYEDGYVLHISLETGECLDKRPMTNEERQMRLFD